MAVKTILRCGAGTDRGMRRSTNEDRFYADAARGIFVVIDGVGGHSAGEHAAEIARDVVRERLERATGTAEQRLREAIALANNEIWRQSREHPEWSGMACVLTAAIVEDDIVTVGHVGDSRLYMLRAGEVRKITRDHSPVGEREDRGEISEEAAMRHERRNEIYRDVGSTGERNPDDAGFVDLMQFPMPADGALLLCSDGLTDQLTSAEIGATMARNAADLDAAVLALIAAANKAGGKDNVTVVVVAGPEYVASPVEEVAVVKAAPRRLPRWVVPSLWGITFGVAAGFALGNFAPVATGPRTIVAGVGGIRAALDNARPGDVVEIAPGRYRETIELREGVRVRAQRSGVTIVSPDGGPAVVARGVKNAAIEGVWIVGDATSPLSAGVEIVNSNASVSNLRISGAGIGIEIRGHSEPAISGSQIIGNIGVGVAVHDDAKPRLVNNLIAANGHTRSLPGVDVEENARPVLRDNGIVDNGAEPIRIHAPTFQRADYAENFFGGVDAEDAVMLQSAEVHP